VAAMLGYLFLGITGHMSWSDVLDNWKPIILAYLAVEGGADVIGRVKGEQ